MFSMNANARQDVIQGARRMKRHVGQDASAYHSCKSPTLRDGEESDDDFSIEASDKSDDDIDECLVLTHNLKAKIISVNLKLH